MKSSYLLANPPFDLDRHLGHLEDENVCNAYIGLEVDICSILGSGGCVEVISYTRREICYDLLVLLAESIVVGVDML